MGRRVTEAQWVSVRAVSEGEPATRVRVAAILGVDVSHVHARAAAEGWKTVDFRNQEIRSLYREAQAIAAGLSGGEAAEGFAGTPQDLDSADATPGGAWPERPKDGDADAARVAPGVEGDAGAGRTEADKDGVGDTAPAGHGPAQAGVGADGAAARVAEAADDLAGADGGPAQMAGVATAPGQVKLRVPEWDRLEPVELLANASGFVARQIGRLIANADRRGGRLDKAQVEGLAALAKMMDRWEALATLRARQDRTKSDAELADIFAKITDKIIELAEAEARRIRGRDRSSRARARRRGGVVRPDAAGADPALAAG